MISIFFAFFAAAFFVAAMAYTNSQRSRWKLLDNGLRVQRRTSNYKAHFLFSLSGSSDTSSIVPALWEIKKPFSKEPRYITQHEDQLRSWWGPLSTHFASLGQNQKTVEFIRFAPTLGIYIQINASKKTKDAPEEEIVGMLLKEATATWKPRRFEVDSSYPIRESLMANWNWAVAVAAFVGMHGVLAYMYVHFLGDLYYVSTGITMAIASAGALAFWFYTKMEGSLYRMRTVGNIFLLGFICMSVTSSYALVGLNMISRETVCEISAPVTKWYIQSGKNRSYHAILDLQGCHIDIPLQAQINVRRSEYQTGPTVNIRVSRGILNRYVLEKR